MGNNTRPKKKFILDRTLATTNPVIWGTYTENEEKLLVNRYRNGSLLTADIFHMSSSLQIGSRSCYVGYLS
jgi:hypothetical protein